MIRLLTVIIILTTGAIALFFAHIGVIKESISTTIGIEIVSVLFTVLVLDVLNEYRANQQLCEELIRQLGSVDNALTLRAIAELEHHGWLHKKGLISKAWLRKANMSEGVLFGVDFSKGQLEGAKFINADLTNTNFYRADLRNVTFDGAKMIGASLGAVMLNASFIGADLREANFGECSLDNADFTKACLQGADLSQSNLDKVILKGAIFDKTTKWSKGFNPESKGAKLVPEQKVIQA